MLVEKYIGLIRVFGAKMCEHFGKVYVISSNKAVFDEMSGKYFDEASQKERLVSLVPVLVGNLADLHDEPLARAVEEAGANLVCAVLSAQIEEPSFIMMRVAEADLADESANLAFKADMHIRNAVTDMMRDIACNYSEKAVRAHVAACYNPDAVPDVPMGAHRTAKDKSAIIEKYKARYMDNLHIVYNAKDYDAEEVARAFQEIDSVHASLSKGSLVKFVTEMVHKSESLGALVAATLNLTSAARNSKMKLMIRRYKAGEQIRHSKGKYRLVTFTPGENETEPDYFEIKGKVETAIYYTLLVHKKLTGEDMIDICALMGEFIGVYRALYLVGYDKACVEFFNIMDATDENGNHYQGRYRNFIPNIRKSVDAMVKGKVDDPAIYYYDFHYDSKGNSMGKFLVDADHIIIEQGFLDEVRRLQDPKAVATTA